MKRDCMMIVLACIGLAHIIFVTSVSGCQSDPRQPYLDQARQEGKEPEVFFQEMKEQNPQQYENLTIQFFDAYRECAIEEATNVQVQGCGINPMQKYIDFANRTGYSLDRVVAAFYLDNKNQVDNDLTEYKHYKECAFRYLLDQLFPDRLGLHGK